MPEATPYLSTAARVSPPPAMENAFESAMARASAAVRGSAQPVDTGRWSEKDRRELTQSDRIEPPMR